MLSNKSYNEDELLSRTIDFLRFPMMVCVVLIHTIFPNIHDYPQEYPIYWYTYNTFSQIISRTAVPLFFFISGFLFFYKIENFDIRTYASKLKKRLKSILLPYIFWNAAIILLFFLGQTFLPGMLSDRYKLISEYSLSDWFYAFWDRTNINFEQSGNYPIDYPLWFIRDLMIMVILSPILYILIKHLKLFLIVPLTILWLLNYWPDIAGFGPASYFFLAGSYFSIFHKNFVNFFRHFFPISIVSYLIVIVLELIYFNESFVIYIHNVGILIGIATIVSTTSHYISCGKLHGNKFLTNSSFFIYAFHAIPLGFLIKFIFKLFKPQTEVTLLLWYVLCPMIIVSISIILYYIIRKFLPRFTAIITGGR